MSEIMTKSTNVGEGIRGEGGNGGGIEGRVVGVAMEDGGRHSVDASSSFLYKSGSLRPSDLLSLFFLLIFLLLLLLLCQSIYCCHKAMTLACMAYKFSSIEHLKLSNWHYRSWTFYFTTVS